MTLGHRIFAMSWSEGTTAPAMADTVLTHAFSLEGPTFTLDELLIYEDGTTILVTQRDIPSAEHA